MLAWDGPYSPYIHACDASPRPSPWQMPQRRMTHWLLVASLAGEERLRIEDEHVHVPEGASYLIQPGQLHRLGSPGGSTPAWVHFDLLFDPRRAKHPHGVYEIDLGPRASFMQPDARAAWGLDLPPLIPAALRPRFATEVPSLIARWREGTRGAVLEATARLSVLLAVLIDHALGSQGQRAGALTRSERLARAESVARASLGRGIGVAGMAAAAGWSRARFAAAWRAGRGETPGAFLRRERMNLAKNLLRRADLDIAEVGALVGHPDPTVFGRTFRRTTGQTPSQWRAGPTGR